MKGKLIYIIGAAVITICAAGVGIYFLMNGEDTETERGRTTYEEVEKEYTEIGSIPQEVSRHLRDAYEDDAYERVEVRAVSRGDLGGWYLIAIGEDEDGVGYYTRIETVNEHLDFVYEGLAKSELSYETVHVLLTVSKTYTDEAAIPRETEHILHTWVSCKDPLCPNEWQLLIGHMVAPSDHPAMQSWEKLN